MRKLLVLLVAVGAALAVAAYWFTPPANGTADAGFGTEPVERGDLTESVPATGTIRPRQTVLVGSEIAGRVVKLFAHSALNQGVRVDEPLLQLDPELAKLTLAQAEESLERAKLQVMAGELKIDSARVGYDLTQKLLAKELGNSKAVDQARLQLKAAETEVAANRISLREAENAIKRAQLGLRKTVLLSPVDGTILDRTVEVGQLIGPANQGHLFTIASDLARVQLHTQVAESDIGRVRLGQRARFTVYAYSDSDYHPEGLVAEIRQLPTPALGAMAQSAIYYDAVIDVTNEPRSGDSAVAHETKIGGAVGVDGPRPPRPAARDQGWKLMPGMSANVDIILRVHHDVWKVQTAALGFQLDDTYQTERAKQKLKEWEKKIQWQPVWTLGNDHKPWPVFVRLGGTDGNQEAGIGDARFREVLEWEPGMRPDPNDPAAWPRVITVAPPVKKSGLFDQLKLKI